MPHWTAARFMLSEQFRGNVDHLRSGALNADELLTDGQTSKEIGRTLGVSHRTVEVYRARLMKAYKAGTTAELVNKLLAGGQSLAKP